MKDALNIYSQMSKTLVDIVAADCAFPDMKNSNWLLTDRQLRLADTKSFVFTNTQQNMTFDAQTNVWAKHPLQTLFITPPEFNQSHVNCSADKMHAYMLGKNLYQYLTGASPHEIHDLVRGRDADFSDLIFRTNEGKVLQKLIESLIRIDPDTRMSVSLAAQQLNNLELRFEKKERRMHLYECTQYSNNPLINEVFNIDESQPKLTKIQSYTRFYR